MSTKTMRLPPRRVLSTHSGSSNNKRKERDDGFDGLKPSIPTVTSTKVAKPDKPRKALEPPPPSSSNQLLAGYLAHEFLTKGTLFGQTWDLAQAENPTAKHDKKKEKEKEKPSEKVGAEPTNRRAEQQTVKEKYERYVEVTGLLEEKGAHLPGIVNPTQLARFLRL